MAKFFHITCTLPNASNLISGIKFVEHATCKGWMRSEEAVEEAVAVVFKSIKGYDITEAPAPKQKPAQTSGAKIIVQKDDRVSFPPSDEQIDSMLPADMLTMLSAEKIDASAAKTPQEIAALLKKVSGEARDEAVKAAQDAAKKA